MIKDITIGQFFPGSSPIHKLDPRAKILILLVYIITLFLVKNFFSLLLLFLFSFICDLISKISAKSVWKSIRALIFIVIFTAVLQIVYNKNGTVLLKPFPQFDFCITSGGVFTAVFLVLRIIALILLSSLLTYTTSPTMLTDAIERLLSPLKLFHIKVHSLAMMMTIALRFIPTLIREIDIIMSAQKARGAKLDAGKFGERIKALISVFVPLFVSSFRRAAELAVAMECRCYTDGANRSRLKVMRFALRDYLAFFICAVIFAGALVVNYVPLCQSLLFERVI